MLTPPMSTCLNPRTYSSVFGVLWRHYVYGISCQRPLSLECKVFFKIWLRLSTMPFAQRYIVGNAHAQKV